MYRLATWEDSGCPDSINDGWSEVLCEGSMEEILEYLREHNIQHLEEHKEQMGGKVGFFSYHITYIGHS